MQLELLIFFSLEDGEDRIYRREVDRPYSRVPIAGELVQLDDEPTFGMDVDHVSWDNELPPSLEFELEEDGLTDEQWLIDAGFERIDAGAYPEEDEEEELGDPVEG